MLKQIHDTFKKIILPGLGTAPRDSIQPFKEQPSPERYASSPENSPAINASDLFSMFTADIIREKVVFTR